MPDGDGAINRVAFTSILAAAMAIATFAGPAFAVLASFIIDELGLTRAELGWAVGAFAVTGALASPLVGRLTDVIGGRKAATAIFGISGLGLLAISAAPTYTWLIAGAMLAGVGQAAGNPGTNKLISVHIPEGRRGAVTGLKQSGVQMSVFLAGILLPTGALAWGWRPTVALAGALALLFVAAVFLIVPHDPPSVAADGTERGVVWSSPVIWLMVYGLLMGLGGAIYTYLPLYGEEELGLSVAVAGSIAGFSGLVAVFSRILWARHAEKDATYIRSLTQIAILSVFFAGTLLLAPQAGSWLLWVGALGIGASATAWNSVGMLAVMAYAGQTRAGGASGVVLLGFLAGYGLGPPAFGWSVDLTDSYAPGLWGVLGVFLIAALLAFTWNRTTRRAR